jgi:hypothetical protein
MQTWDALHLRKGKTRLRVTALPGRAGHVARRRIHAGSGQRSPVVPALCQLRVLGRDEAGLLAQRLPGADLVLLPAGNAPQLLVLGPPETAQPPQAGHVDNGRTCLQGDQAVGA